MSLEDLTIVKLFIENGYLNIQELARMRAVSVTYRNIIDRLWPLIVQKMIGSIPRLDINTVVKLVYKNDDLLLKVLEQRKLKTGYVLANSGSELFVLLGLLPDHVSPKSRELMIKEMPNDPNNYKQLEGCKAAREENLEKFKESYYNRSQSRGVPVVDTATYMSGIFRHYLAARLYRNSKNYSINWEEVEKWDQTAFYKFIKPSIRASDLSALIVMFHGLSNETIRREKHNILSFIKRTLSPYIEQEKILLQNALTHTITELPILYGPANTLHAAETAVISHSLIRRLVVAAAAIDAKLTEEYFKLAHELFDLSNDKEVLELPEAVIRSETFEFLPTYVKSYKLPFNIYSLMLALLKKVKVDDIIEAPRDLNNQQKRNALKIKLALMQGTEPTAIEEQYGPLYNLEDEYNQTVLPIDINKEVGVLLSLLMPTKTCMEMFDKLPIGGRPYDIFLNRDLQFWKHYISVVIGCDGILQEDDPEYEQKRHKLMKLLMHHAAIYSVDVAKYILSINAEADLKEYADRPVLYDGVNIVETWLDKVINEVIESRGIKKNNKLIRDMPNGEIWYDNFD